MIIRRSKTSWFTFRRESINVSRYGSPVNIKFIDTIHFEWFILMPVLSKWNEINIQWYPSTRSPDFESNSISGHKKVQMSSQTQYPDIKSPDFEAIHAECSVIKPLLPYALISGLFWLKIRAPDRRITVFLASKSGNRSIVVRKSIDVHQTACRRESTPPASQPNC